MMNGTCTQASFYSYTDRSAHCNLKWELWQSSDVCVKGKETLYSLIYIKGEWAHSAPINLRTIKWEQPVLIVLRNRYAIGINVFSLQKVFHIFVSCIVSENQNLEKYWFWPFQTGLKNGIKWEDGYMTKWYVSNKWVWRKEILAMGWIYFSNTLFTITGFWKESLYWNLHVIIKTNNHVTRSFSWMHKTKQIQLLECIILLNILAGLSVFTIFIHLFFYNTIILNIYFIIEDWYHNPIQRCQKGSFQISCMITICSFNLLLSH